MSATPILRPLLAILSLAVLSPSAWPACSADSGDRPRHLLALYTSEGCSSCPPADRFLSGLGQEAGVVPLAFHVDYWNHLGWPDRFARPEYSQRQRAGAGVNGSRFVYTPQFVLDGRDWRPGRTAPPWRDAPAGPAGRLSLRLDAADPGRLAVSGRWRGGLGQVYLALYENNLESVVRAGENAGRRLRHDFVVRRLTGPLPLDAGAFRHDFALAPDWKRGDLGVAAFVEATPAGSVVQALRLAICPD